MWDFERNTGAVRGSSSFGSWSFSWSSFYWVGCSGCIIIWKQRKRAEVCCRSIVGLSCEVQFSQRLRAGRYCPKRSKMTFFGLLARRRREKLGYIVVWVSMKRTPDKLEGSGPGNSQADPPMVVVQTWGTWAWFWSWSWNLKKFYRFKNSSCHLQIATQKCAKRLWHQSNSKRRFWTFLTFFSKPLCKEEA